MIRLIFLCLCLSLTFSAYSDDETTSTTDTETTEASSTDSENTGSETDSSTSADSSGTSIVDFFKDVLGFIDHGIYDVIGDFFKYYVYAVALFNLELKMAAIELATETAEALTEFLDISGTINELLADIDLKIAAFISYLKIPEAITMLLSAHLTRFILDLV